MAKTAFLVLAHQHPQMLARLLKRLEHPEAIAVVHIDRRIDLKPFLAALGNRAHFLDDQARVAVHWCGFSMVSAILNLIRTALTLMPHAERLVRLSGVDYPLLPIGELMRVLDRDVEILQVDRAL